MPGERKRIHAQLVTDSRIEQWRGRHLDDLLMAALYRTVPFVEVDDIPGRVAENLHLDMAGPVHRLLKEDRSIAERRCSLPDRARRRIGEIIDPLHPA